MKELKVKFWQIDNCVVAKILECPRDLIGKNTLGSHEEYDIMSVAASDLQETTLYLYGASKSVQASTLCYAYSSNEEAQKAIENFSLIIEDINNKRKNKESEEESDDVFRVTIAQ